MRLPIRARLTLLSTGLAGLVLAAAAAVLLLGFRAELANAVDEGLRSRLSTMVGDPANAVGSPAGGDEAFAQFVHADGTLVTPLGLEPLLPRNVTDRLGAPSFFDRELETEGERVPARILAAPVDGGVLVVGADVEDQREAVARLTAMVAIGGPVLLAALAALGWVLAGAALRPVERLREEAAAISTLEPGRRLADPETGDELERLAETLNAMIDRLREALDRDRRFVDEASHELRTPLGVMQAEIDLALKGSKTREELDAALGSIAQETERLRRLTQDLLVLARADRGRLPVHRTEVDVSGIARRVAAELAPRAASRGVDLRASGEQVRAWVDGDRIRQVVENLVDNAIRHAGDGGAVEVVTRREDGRVLLAVTDTGAGFADELVGRAAEPFARGRADRDGDGAGLGLSIVRAVVEAHGGTLHIGNLVEGGASVSLDLPA